MKLTLYLTLMKAFLQTSTFLLSCIFLFAGNGIHALSYNYYATTECLREPQGVFYGGGIIVNPEFNHSTEGWEAFGQGKVEERRSEDGNKFIVAYNRTHRTDSFSQKVQVEQGKIYCFSAWVQVSEGSDTVAVVFSPEKGNVIRGGRVIAKSGCWSHIKGGMVANFTSPVEIYFESHNISNEIWVDNISLQPFTKKQWKSHQEDSILKVRRSNVRFQVTNADKTPMEGAKVSIKQTKPGFPFGCGMNQNILRFKEYRTWFAKRFKYTTFTNQMKWYSNEPTQGVENYTISDAMVKFARRHGISIRGHNVFWDDPKYQPSWLYALSAEELRSAAAKRISSVVSRYRGKLIAWDVVNENLHFSFFEDKLGANASAEFYYRAQELDPGTTMFLNDFDTFEYSDDEATSPPYYLKKLEEILSFAGKSVNLLAGIGLQGHFGSGQPNLAYMRAVLDIFSTTGLPIWLTEVDVVKESNQAEYLEEILREGFSHPALQGIIMFAGPKIAGFNVTTLADENFENTPSGDVVDKLIKEWGSEALETRTDAQGLTEASLFHGDYQVTVKHPLTNALVTTSLRVTRDHTFHVHIGS